MDACTEELTNIAMGHLHWKMKTILQNNREHNKLPYSWNQIINKWIIDAKIIVILIEVTQLITEWKTWHRYISLIFWILRIHVQAKQQKCSNLTDFGAKLVGRNDVTNLQPGGYQYWLLRHLEAKFLRFQGSLAKNFGEYLIFICTF